MSALIWWALVIALLGVWPLAAAILFGYEFLDYALIWLLNLMVGVFVLAIVGFGGAWITYGYETKTFEMKSIGTSTATQGRFTSSIFLGSGYISQEPVYYWYGKNPDGSFALANVTAGVSRVIETTDDKPRAVCRRGVSSWPKFVSGPYDDANDGTHCTFYVPPGSIASEIDLEIPK